MGKNREPVKPVESDSGQEHDDEGSEFETDSEPEVQPTQTPTPKAPSEEEEETGSETESESESEAVKQESGEMRSKSAVASPSPAKRQLEGRQLVSLKRPAEDDENNAANAKKKMKVVEAAALLKKAAGATAVEKKLFQRLWREEDAIGILKTMLEKIEIDPMSDSFYDYLKKTLKVQFDFSRTQIRTKIKKLKRKYLNNKRKEKAKFSNPHEQEAYNLSNRIWGRRVSEKQVISTIGSELLQNLDACKEVISTKSVDATEGNEELKALKEHLELYTMQLEIHLRQTKLFMDAVKHVLKQ